MNNTDNVMFIHVSPLASIQNKLSKVHKKREHYISYFILHRIRTKSHRTTDVFSSNGYIQNIYQTLDNKAVFITFNDNRNAIIRFKIFQFDLHIYNRIIVGIKVMLITVFSH